MRYCKKLILGRTPLHVAMYKGNIEIIKILLQHCAQHKDSKFYDFAKYLICKMEIGNTPLHVAAFMGNIDFVKLLLKSGAKHMPNRFHNSPYDIATHFKHANVALLLARHWGKQLLQVSSHISPSADINYRT